MLRPRIIPFLLYRDKGLVKTFQFKNEKYVGDPLNAVKIFNEKEVDELVFLDIDATSKGTDPDYNLIEKLARESRMPICYGGGIKTLDQARRIINLGIEKIAISSSAINDISILEEISKVIGVQSVVVVIDYKKTGLFGKKEIFINNGNTKTGKELFSFISDLEKKGNVGEVVINSIEHDGMANGYDWETIDKVRDLFSGPLTVIGGAGRFEDIQKLLSLHPLIGTGAGSLFVFKGRFKAVLINYPSYEEKQKLIYKA